MTRAEEGEMSDTRLFVVLLGPKTNDAAELLEARLGKANICQVQAGAWLVRCDKHTSQQLAESLDITKNKEGLVVTAKHYAGYADSTVCETLEAWEGTSTASPEHEARTNNGQVFLVLLSPEGNGAAEELEARLGKANTCRVQSGAWLVRSNKRSSHQLSEHLGVGHRKNSMIVRAKYYAGYGDKTICKTLEAWQTPTRPEHEEPLTMSKSSKATAQWENSDLIALYAAAAVTAAAAAAAILVVVPTGDRWVGWLVGMSWALAGATGISMGRRSATSGRIRGPNDAGDASGHRAKTPDASGGDDEARRQGALRLTWRGRQIAEFLKASTWAREAAAGELEAKTSGKRPYQIDEAAGEFVALSAAGELRERIAECAYECGSTTDMVHSVLRVRLRDELLRRHGWPVRPDQGTDEPDVERPAAPGANSTHAGATVGATPAADAKHPERTGGDEATSEPTASMDRETRGQGADERTGTAGHDHG